MISKLHEGQPSKELLNNLINPKLKGLDLFGPHDEFNEKKQFIDQITSCGLEPQKAENLYTSLTKINKLPDEMKDLPLADKSAKLQAMGSELDSALSLPPGTMAKNFNDNIDKLKVAAYQDPLIGKKLASLAANNPEINRILQPLDQLRMASPQPFNSLVDMAKSVGLVAPALLLEIAKVDPLNPQPPLEPLSTDSKAADDKTETPNQAENSEQVTPPTSEIFLFTSRDEVANFLAKPGSKSLAKASMAGLDLSGLDFSNLNLTQADLRETNLTKTIFKNSTMIKALFDESIFDQTILSGADLTAASLSSIKATRTDFSQAKLGKADLSKADLTDSYLQGFEAEWAIFAETKLPKNLSRAKLSRASFSQVNLDGANFEEADLSFAEISNSSLVESIFVRATLNNLTVTGSNLRQAKFNQAQAEKSKFLLDTNLSGCIFTLSLLSEAIFTGSRAPRADFRGVRANLANLGQIDLTGSSFVGAFLRQAILFRSDLTGADFRGADLFKASLGGANLRGANFSQANLYGSDLYRISIDRTTSFQNSNLNSTCLTLDQIPVVKN
jgi:uncharacterized protein YjbI with pentapeptide repeats